MPDLQKEYRILSSLESEGIIGRLVEEHETKARLKTPAELLEGVPTRLVLRPEAVVMLAYDAATEIGLPHFHRLLSTHLGEEGALGHWTDDWTSEEWRHGILLLRLLERTEGLSMVEVDRLCHRYLKAGFRPDWKRSPYRLLSYTVLQERSTQLSYRGVLPYLVDERGVHKIARVTASEEMKHYGFYLTVVKAIMARDPCGLILALLAAHEGFVMPGAKSPGFSAFSRLASRLQVFDLAQYAAILEEVFLELGLTEPRDDLPAEVQQSLTRLLAAPAACREKHERILALPKRKVTFPFLPGWETAA